MRYLPLCMVTEDATADNMKDLEELWKDFCKCEGFFRNTVNWVERM